MTNVRAHISTAAATTAVGLGRSDYEGSQEPQPLIGRGFFVCCARARSLNERAGQEGFGPAGSFVPVDQPVRFRSPSWSGVTVLKTVTKEHTMCQSTTTPESGNKPLFHTAYDLANLIADCRAIAEALPAVIPVRAEEMTLDIVSRISGLASALGRIINTAEDRAYDLGAALHDLHREPTEGV